MTGRAFACCSHFHPGVTRRHNGIRLLIISVISRRLAALGCHEAVHHISAGLPHQQATHVSLHFKFSFGCSSVAGFCINSLKE